jgi:hypothetical protein
METFLLHLLLHRILVKMIRERGYPLPTALRITPFSIVYWNVTKGMTDVFSRMQNNVKPSIQQLHPYAYIWIREVMMMIFNAHILHRLFAIEGRLKGPKSFLCLRQLRNTLNSEASFRDSIASLVRNGIFQFSHALFATPIVVPRIVNAATRDDVSAACAPPVVIRSMLTNSSKSFKKLKFLNTQDGIRVRRASGAHVATIDSKHVGCCVLCGHRTQHFCIGCSKAVLSHSSEMVKFYTCTTASQSVGKHKHSHSCFEMLHSADKLYVDEQRQKIVSEKRAKSLSELAVNNALKRKRNSDEVGAAISTVEEDEDYIDEIEL